MQRSSTRRNIVDLLDDLNITESTELEQLSTKSSVVLDSSSSGNSSIPYQPDHGSVA